MIAVKVDEPKSDKWKAWIKKCKEETKAIVKLAQDGKTFKIKDALYKGKQKSYKISETFFFNNAKPFFGKCVFCEGLIYRDQHGSVEHFRPKGRVENIDFTVIKIRSGRSEIPHPGYYWLIYDWTNLIPACVLCNERSSAHSDKSIGKGCRFPVIGAHATSPGDEKNEKPLLINPTTRKSDDNPKKHLYVSEMGVMVPKTARGEACIDIFGLNDRDLSNARKETYDSAYQEATLLFQAANLEPNGEQKKKLEKKIKHYLCGEAQYSAAGKKGVEDAIKKIDLTRDLLLGGEA